MHVVVTGASRGIGACLAGKFAAEGSHVSLVARSADAIADLAGRFDGTAVAVDLADPGARRGLIERLEREAGQPVDVLVNNAGVDMAGYFPDVSEDDLARVFAVNLVGAAELCRQALPGMIQRGRGHIVNVSSLAGVGALPGMAAYAATKAGLTQFTAGLRADLRGLPIGTTLVEVGFVSVTQMTERTLAYPPMGRAWRRLKRLGAMADTDLERLCEGVVAGVRADKRHVRYPIRARGLLAVGESTRKVTEMLLTGVAPRE
jgi:short-subunit dehydrogenase